MGAEIRAKIGAEQNFGKLNKWTWSYVSEVDLKN